MDQQQFRNAQGRRLRPVRLGDGIDFNDLAPSNPALSAALRPYLDDLTFPQRDALRLVFWERLSEREAAQRLGISQPSLHERLERAFENIRKALASSGAGETYADVRTALQPSRDAGGYETARCIECGTFLAQYRPNALGFSPALRCIDHNGTTNSRARSAAPTSSRLLSLEASS